MRSSFFLPLSLLLVLSLQPQGSESLSASLKQSYLEKMVKNLKLMSVRDTCLDKEVEALVCLGTKKVDQMKEVGRRGGGMMILDISLQLHSLLLLFFFFLRLCCIAHFRLVGSKLGDKC